MGSVSQGPGARSAAGVGRAKRSGNEAQLVCQARGHTLRPSHGPQPCGHVCPARVDSPSFSTWGPGRRRSDLSKGGSRSLRREGSRKCCLIASGREENTAKARQAQRRSFAKWLLLWVCAALGQGRSERDTGPGSRAPCFLSSRPASGVQKASATWILQPDGLGWTLALLGDPE